MPKNINKKGRNNTPPFVQLPHFILDSAAFASLSPLAQALLVHLVRRYNGRNNGEIGLGHRKAADLCNVNKNTIKRGFDELEDRGFIKALRRGGFNMKDPSTRRATEWRLTWIKKSVLSGDRAAQPQGIADHCRELRLIASAAIIGESNQPARIRVRESGRRKRLLHPSASTPCSIDLHFPHLLCSPWARAYPRPPSRCGSIPTGTGRS